MIFSRLFVLNFWIYCIFASASAQELTSTLPASNRTCPGTRITFNCSITGSDSLANLIIAWRSPEYIGHGRLLHLTTANMMGDSVTSMINDDVTAQLLYNGDRGGTPTLESQLQLIVSNDSLSSTVSCHNVISGTLRDVTFYIPSVPGSPHNAKRTEDLRGDDFYVIFLTWDAPLDYDEEDIDHYIVQIPSLNNIIQTNAKATFVSISITRCISDIHINVSAVDRCGRDGPSTVVVPHLNASTVNKTAPTQQVTTRQENQTGSLETAVIVLGVIVGFVVVMITMCIIWVLCLYCSSNIQRRKIRKTREEYDRHYYVTAMDPPYFEGLEIVNEAVSYEEIPFSSDSWTALDRASYNSRTDVVKSLLHPGVQHEKKDEQLLTLCRDGCTAKVEVFKSQWADPNFRDEDGATPLYVASQNGHKGVVELLLDKGANVNQQNKDGDTPLYMASQNGHKEVVELLLDKGANVDQQNKYGQTALHHASSSGHKDVVELLVGFGAQIDNKDKYGQTALHHASSSGHTGVVKLLVDCGAKIDNKDKDGQTALHLASNSGHTDVVKLLVDCGAQIDNKDKDGQTALHLASRSGHTDVVELLVDSGAQLDKRDRSKRLLTFCKNGCIAEVRDFKSLLDQGADPNIQDEDGYHPLWYASSYGKRDLVELFLQYKADVNLKTNDGETALHISSFNGETDVVKLLVDCGARIDNKDKYGRTALHLASKSGHTDVVQLLVDCGAQIDNKDKDGQTALHHACNSGHTGVVKLLVDCGAQIDNNDKDGWTALHRGSYSGHKHVVKLLVDSGAQLDNKDNDGQTALHLASNSGHTDVVKLLVDSGAHIDSKDKYGQTALNLASKSHHTDVVKLDVGCGAQLDNKRQKVVKSGQITDPDRLFRDLSLVVCDNYFEIGIELGLKGEVLNNELETGKFIMLQGSKKAVKMLQLWQQSVKKEDFTYSVLAAALEKHGFQSCARKYCYTSTGLVVKSGQIIDHDRLFNNLSVDICSKYCEIGIELGLQVTVLQDELETGKISMLPGNKKAIKMLQLWRDSAVKDDVTYSVLAAALEKHGFQRCAHKYCYTSKATAKPE